MHRFSPYGSGAQPREIARLPLKLYHTEKQKAPSDVTRKALRDGALRQIEKSDVVNLTAVEVRLADRTGARSSGLAANRIPLAFASEHANRDTCRRLFLPILAPADSGCSPIETVASAPQIHGALRHLTRGLPGS
ncbi:hypothetical protein C0Z16_25645 [Paraburkholderia rhynchosiae]|uniref:Uncharacterized protein n=1 Tax=Paraburkholderia rhynchosiae TaxID=487049 RepID=A0ABX4UZ74_9BURK|nr:hypothetical protein C0Z16_25645 [Paraburkholderia rhynchosiae]